MTIEQVFKNNSLIYRYIRGSHAYGLNVPESDIDESGVFVAPEQVLYSLKDRYCEQVSDEKNDLVFYEIGRWFELLLKTNPNAIESLFIPENCIIDDVHPIIKDIRDNRDMFLSKDIFDTLMGYSVAQIKKARGLNKKIVNPVEERKDILDFCYTFKDQGSYPIKNWLMEHDLNQKYVGLVNLPNMPNMYGLYYDFAAYFRFEYKDIDDPYWDSIRILRGLGFDGEQLDRMLYAIQERFEKIEFFHYKGIINPDAMDKSNDVRLSSIPKDEKPICFMSYNKNGYESHCRMYKEYQDWVKNRNPVRYESNLGHNYDSKNVMHCMRLTRMAKELAKGEGFNVKRTYDREYLLDIRNHKFEYEDIMEQLNKEVEEFNEAVKTCNLPEHVDSDQINKLLIDCRKKFYKMK